MFGNHRKLISIIVIMFLVLGMLTGCAGKEALPAASPEAPVSLDQEKIMNSIRELTSEKYMGRLAGTKENQMTAEYIAGCFEKLGLENPKGLNGYMQPYVQPSIVLNDSPILQIVDKKGTVMDDFKYVENFVLRRLSNESGTMDMTEEMYLIDKPDLLSESNKKLKGKVILLPWELYDLLNSQNNPADFAEMFGAKAVISEFDLDQNKLGYKYLKVRPLAEEWMKKKPYKPFAFVDSPTFSKLEEAAKKGSKLHFSFNSTINLESTVNNVVGLIPGSDPKSKDKYIIIGAHFDHLGNNMNGSYNPGALDNASGVAVMLELARVIKENKTPPKQSILFIALNGEESGLLGAQAYCKNPVSPLKGAVMINLDMLGSASKTPLTIAAVSGRSKKSLRDDMVKYAEKLGIEYNKDYEDASDHAIFDMYGVPSVCLINIDLGYGYHSPHDGIEAVDVAKTKKIADLVMEYINNSAY